MEPQEKKGFFRGLIDKISGAESIETPPESLEASVPEPTPQSVLPLTPAAVPETTVQETQMKPSFFERLKSGLKKTKDGLVGRIDIGFADAHVEPVKLENLWTLFWHNRWVTPATRPR